MAQASGDFLYDFFFLVGVRNSFCGWIFFPHEPASCQLLGIEVDMALIVLGCVFGVLVIIHAAGLVHTSRNDETLETL